MPKGYVIFTTNIRDRAAYDAYVQKGVPTVMQAGGRPIIAEDNPEVVEGEWNGPRTVVIEFDSVEAAKTWYNSSEYQAVAGERRAASEGNVVIVPGFEMPGG